MAEYRYCPKCNGLLEDDGTCSCGWKPRKHAALHDGPKLCQWNDHGFVCCKAAHLSTGVMGAGPWYCRAHMPKALGWGDDDWPNPPAPEPISEVDKRVNQLVARHAEESEHDWSMRCRSYVLDRLRKGFHPHMREPGEEG